MKTERQIIKSSYYTHKITGEGFCMSRITQEAPVLQPYNHMRMFNPPRWKRRRAVALYPNRIGQAIQMV